MRFFAGSKNRPKGRFFGDLHPLFSPATKKEAFCPNGQKVDVGRGKSGLKGRIWAKVVARLLRDSSYFWPLKAAKNSAKFPSEILISARYRELRPILLRKIGGKFAD